MWAIFLYFLLNVNTILSEGLNTLKSLINLIEDFKNFGFVSHLNCCCLHTLNPYLYPPSPFIRAPPTDHPFLLLPALVLLSSGGNQIRLAAVQLGDLFPDHRSTAITMLMGSYSVSSSVFYLFQVQSEKVCVFQSSPCHASYSFITYNLLTYLFF